MSKLRRRPNRQQIIKAQEFRLVDANGINRGCLALDHNDDPYLTLRDRNGEMRATLRIDQDGRPFFDLSNGRGEVRVIMTLSKHGDPSLVFYDGVSEDFRIGILIDQDGMAALEMCNQNEGYVSLHVERDKGASLGFFHGDRSVPSIGLRVSKDGSGQIQLFDENDKLIWSAPSNEQSTTEILEWDENSDEA